jgi:SNF2 family DNA or RNA helicase
MRKLFVPRPYQTLATQFIAEHKRCALWAGMGMGKTITSLNVLDILHNVLGEDEPSLVLAPLRVARDTWPEETLKWDHLRDIEVVPITGTLEQRRAALRRKAPIYSVNYEQVPWLVETLGDKWPFKNVIADESTKLKSFRLRQGGTRAQALAKVAHTKAVRWVNLTGTPASNGLKDLWGQTWFLDHGVRLGRTYSAFEERFFRPVRNDDGYFDWLPAEFTQPLIQGRLKDICLTLDPKDWFDLEEPVVSVRHVKLPPKAQAKYKEMEREFFTQIDGHDIEAFNAASKSQKCLQLASGAIYTSPDPKDDSWAQVHDEKLAELESIVNEASGMPVLVAYHFVSDRERILKAFPKAVDLATTEGMLRFRAGKAPIGIAHPQSLGHGIDGLQNVTNIIAFFSHWWALEYHDQMVERIGPVRQMQAGNDRPVFIYYIVAKGTIDELVIQRHASKRSVQDILLEAMKGKR